MMLVTCVVKETDGRVSTLQGSELTRQAKGGIIVCDIKNEVVNMSDTVHAAANRYTIIPSPIGELLIAAQEARIVHVAFENHDFASVLERLEGQFGAPVLRDDETLRYATEQFDEYFAGTRESFELPIQRGNTERFITTVQQNLATIPYGETRSYGQLAQQLNKPGAARAVGSACARNPMPIIQPCHRVVRADGTYGEFSGTPGAKKYLLALERGEKSDATAA